MNLDMREWLCQQLRPLVDVRFCAPAAAAPNDSRPGRPALRIGLWTGVFIHVHSLVAEPRARQLRRSLQEDEQASCATLFLLDAALAPQPDQSLAPPDWMLALHSLGQERIYLGALRGSTPGLLAVHLEAQNGGLRFAARYGPAFLPRRLHTGRVNIRHRSVRGFWNLAHFGARPFWQRATRERLAGARRFGEDRAQQDAAGAVPQGDLALAQCFALLGLEPDATREQVQGAWRREAFNLHPDVSALPTAIAEERFRALGEALERIRAARGWSR